MCCSITFIYNHSADLQFMVWNLFVCATFLLSWVSSWAPDSSFCWDAKMESHSCSLTIPSRRLAYLYFKKVHKLSISCCILTFSKSFCLFSNIKNLCIKSSLLLQILTTSHGSLKPQPSEFSCPSSYYLPVCTLWARFCHCPPIPSIPKMTTNCNPLWKHKSRKSLRQSFPPAVICYVLISAVIEVPIEEKEFS